MSFMIGEKPGGGIAGVKVDENGAVHVSLRSKDSVSGISTEQKSIDGSAFVTLSTTLAGEDITNDVVRVELQNGYELIGAGSTAVVPGSGSGAIGDYLEAVIVKANTGTIAILDGATTVLVIPASTAVGTRYEIKALATTAWKITTPASTEAICIGRFT